eukprot:847277-Prorocentrum_lima.AAC.1
MSALITDAKQELLDTGTNLTEHRLQTLNIDDVFYADDTVIISGDRDSIQKYLHSIETASAQHGL